MTGGLGPTRDDLTKYTLADYFGSKLIINQEVLSVIEDFFKKRGRVMIDSNRNQALVPDKCKALPNNHGTAPGMWFIKDGSHVISMPGVPYEMKPMLLDQVLPGLSGEMGVPVLVHKTVMTHGIPESYLAEMISEWEDALPDCMKLAYLPRPGIVRLRITVTGICAKEAKKMLQEKINSLKEIIGDHIFGFDDILLEQAIGRLLKEKALFLSTAESCTGGNIAKLITSVPGSSAYFKGSMVAYSNELKISELGVSHEHIEQYGAVSREVIEAMALGAVKRLCSDVSLATSGVAGPDGGTEEKPVGTVWIAVAEGNRVFSEKFSFGGHRELIIEQASIKALGMLHKWLAGFTEK
jgi:nicotinamide-nucleotide amidase